MKNIKEWLDWGIEVLKEAGSESPRLDAEILLSEILGCNRIVFYTHPERVPDLSEGERYTQWIGRRYKREPVAYIIGHKEFMGYDFNVTLDVLIPRPDTESVVEGVLASVVPKLSSLGKEMTILDLCTGSGAIGIALKKNLEGVQVTLSDLSEKALAVAKKNAEKLKEPEIQMYCGDLFQALPEGVTFDLIVSNPPYIPDKVIKTLEPDVRVYEPNLALSGGESGYTLYKRIAKACGHYLKPGGAIVLEAGDGQAKTIAKLLLDQGLCDIIEIPDLTGRIRGVCAFKKNCV